MEKKGKCKKGSQKKIRSRNQSIQKDKEIQKANRSRIKIPIYDDSDKNEPETIKDYIYRNKKDLHSGKISLQNYIKKIDIDHEQIFIFLKDVLKKDIKLFFKIYENEFFKLSLEQRNQLQEKFRGIKGIVIPEYIKKNGIKENKIEKTFINILKGLKNIDRKDLSIENIDKVFLENNVYFDKEIDIKIPSKYGTKELRFYCLLNDLLFYFRSSNIELKNLFNNFLTLSIFINQINENDENLIAKSNYLFNILYMYLETKDIAPNYFFQIVETCLTFDKEIAMTTLEALKNINSQVKFLINNIPINDYKGEITGNEIIDLEYKNLKIKELSKNINWNIGNKFYTLFSSEDFMLCINYPQNCKYNCFSIGEIGTLVNDFFNLMIHSPPMKQAMIIDTETSKYKYLFNNESILKEFNESVYLVPLPFHNYFRFTNKKSFDLYINVSYKTNNNFIKIIKKYIFFFINKSHEFKNASRIYLRLYDDEIKIKSQIKDIKKLKGNKKYLGEIFDNTQKILDTLFKINNPIKDKNSKSKVKEYGDLLELSLFGCKCDEFFLKPMIFCLSESSWSLSPQNFYHNFCLKMMNNEVEKLDDLCKENFLKNLLNFYNCSEKEEKYGNSTFIERKPHLGIREINRGKTIEKIITMEALREKKKKQIKENNKDENRIDSEDGRQELKEY